MKLMTDVNRGLRHPQPNKRTSADNDRRPIIHEQYAKSENRPGESAGIAVDPNPTGINYAVGEPDLPEFDMSGIHPQYCHNCERDFAANEPLIFCGVRRGDQALVRVGVCCRSVLRSVILREIRR
jgi:hypothetical protein